MIENRTPAPPPPEISRSGSVLFGLLALAWLPAHFLISLNPPRVIGSVHLDSSWQQLVAHDFLNRVQAGVDHVFTYGPLGYFVASPAEYSPDLFWQKCGAEVGLRGIITLLTLLPTLCMPALWQRAVYLVLALLVAPVASDASMLVGLTMGTCYVILRERGLAFSIPLAILFALAGLSKFTYMMLGCVSVGLMSLTLMTGRQWRSALALPLSFATALTLLWIAIGQSLGNLPAFFKGSMEIASGYNESMRLAGPTRNSILAVATLGTIWAGFAWIALRRPRNVRQVLAAALACLSLFLLFKSGYVRHDGGHERIFYAGGILVAGSLWAFPGEFLRNRIVHVIVLLSTLATGFMLDWTTDLPVRTWDLGKGHWEQLRNPGQLKATLDELLALEEKKYDLPDLRARVGEARIDQVPHDQGILFFNNLNVHHRPIFQSYSAYTPYLQTLNGEFYEDEAKAPKFVLLRMDSVDGKLPSMDDSQIYRVLLRRYRPTLLSGAFALFERRSELGLPLVAGRPGEELIQEVTATVGEWVELNEADGLGLLAIDLKPTLAGKVWTTGFRGSRLSLEVRFNGGQTHSYPASHRPLALPFLINPHTPDSRSFIKLFTDELPRRAITAIRIRPRRPEFYEKSYGLKYWRSSPPKALAADDPIVAKILSPEFSPRPQSIEPQKNFSMVAEQGKTVQMAEPPSAVTFRLPPGDFLTTGTFGILSKVPEGASDGVTFRIEQISAAGRTTQLFERTLRPVAADRGPKTFSISGPATAGDTLVFRTLPGAHGNYDWSYWSKVKVDAGR